ncbi:MAG: type II toxin-antitoxin system RelE family toxin [Acidimicrobiales bacterium]
MGKPLAGPLAGCHGARRSTYRIVYRIDDERHLIQVLDVAHRRDAYGVPAMSRSSHGCRRQAPSTPATADRVPATRRPAAPPRRRCPSATSGVPGEG